MKILAIIPARAGSKGIPKKNIKELGGKPLINYTIELAKDVKCFDEILVSTEDEQIATISKEAGAYVPFLRSEKLAGDKVPTIDVLVEVLEKLKDEYGKIYDAICLLQCTSPFRDLEEVKAAIATFKTSNTDSLVSVRQVPDHYNPHWVFEPDANNKLRIATGDEQLITRRQELPKAFYRDGSVYITKADVIINNKSLYGNSTGYFENTSEYQVNLDTMADWDEAKIILENIHKKKKEY